MPGRYDQHRGRPYTRHRAATRAREDTDTCVRCGQWIDKARPYRLPDGCVDLLSWSLEHIPALADGGQLLEPSHSHGAHLGCNASAGAYLGNGRRRSPQPQSAATDAERDASDW